MSNSEVSNFERRQRQRFTAVRDGKPCIELVIGDKRVTLVDLSLDGFSVPSSAECPTGEFDFVMRLIDGFGDKVKGRAMAMNQTPDQIGCRFAGLEPGSDKTLQEWLTVIVICGASVRLTPADAEAIVKGRSLI